MRLATLRRAISFLFLLRQRSLIIADTSEPCSCRMATWRFTSSQASRARFARRPASYQGNDPREFPAVCVASRASRCLGMSASRPRTGHIRSTDSGEFDCRLVTVRASVRSVDWFKVRISRAFQLNCAAMADRSRRSSTATARRSPELTRCRGEVYRRGFGAI